MTAPSRDDLLAKVQNGELTPAEAEGEAARLKLNPIEHRPDPAGFDPLRESFWTLPMAAAWIAYRTPDSVREWWDEYRAECWDWHFYLWRLGFDGPVKEGYFLEQRSKASLVRLRLAGLVEHDEESETSLRMGIPQAKEALWIALKEGFFEATGISAETRRRAPIPAYEWCDLDHIEERGLDVICAGALRYEQVVVRSLPIIKFWPESHPAKPLLILPTTMPPSGGGYMPLYCAAQWIATKGDTVKFDPSDLSVWQVAYSELLARISSDEARVIGVRGGEREPVSGYHFAACPVDYPFAEASIDLLLGNELYLQSYPYLDEIHWSKGFDDSLLDRRGSRWTRLMVLKADVARHWPFLDSSDDAQAVAAVVIPTGAPGRPSIMHLVEAEFRARCNRGEVERSLAREAATLAKWLRSTYPHSQPLTAKTISNRLRNAFRQLVQRPKL